MSYTRKRFVSHNATNLELQQELNKNLMSSMLIYRHLPVSTFQYSILPFLRIVLSDCRPGREMRDFEPVICQCNKYIYQQGRSPSPSLRARFSVSCFTIISVICFCRRSVGLFGDTHRNLTVLGSGCNTCFEDNVLSITLRIRK